VPIGFVPFLAQRSTWNNRKRGIEGCTPTNISRKWTEITTKNEGVRRHVLKLDPVELQQGEEKGGYRQRHSKQRKQTPPVEGWTARACRIATSCRTPASAIRAGTREVGHHCSKWWQRRANAGRQGEGSMDPPAGFLPPLYTYVAPGRCRARRLVSATPAHATQTLAGGLPARLYGPNKSRKSGGGAFHERRAQTAIVATVREPTR
jgi:hypothetical protein